MGGQLAAQVLSANRECTFVGAPRTSERSTSGRADFASTSDNRCRSGVFVVIQRRTRHARAEMYITTITEIYNAPLDFVS